MTDVEWQYAIERRSKVVSEWHRIYVMAVGTDMVGAKRELVAYRKAGECHDTDAEYRLVRRPSDAWEVVE